MVRTAVYRIDSVTSNALQYNPGISDMSLLLTVIRGYALPLLRIHRLRLSLLFAGVFIPLYLFGELADEVVNQEIFSFDRPFLLFMRDQATPFLDSVMLFFSRAGSVLVLGPIALLIMSILAHRRYWGKALFWLLATAGTVLLNIAAKHVFVRSRPDLWTSIAPETTYSFPSGHAMQSMAFVAALVVLGWRYRWIWWAAIAGGAFVLMVGLSRVYLGVHYPSDILAGWSASLAWVLGLSVVLHDHLYKPSASRAGVGRIASAPKK
jgi:membrane-associated phospholipid phosphatase